MTRLPTPGRGKELRREAARVWWHVSPVSTCILCPAHWPHTGPRTPTAGGGWGWSPPPWRWSRCPPAPPAALSSLAAPQCWWPPSAWLFGSRWHHRPYPAPHYHCLPLITLSLVHLKHFIVFISHDRIQPNIGLDYRQQNKADLNLWNKILRKIKLNLSGGESNMIF